MKITYIITRSDTIGGAQKHVLDLSLEMKRKGHEVNVIVGGDGIFIGQLLSKDIKVHQISHLKRQLNLVDDLISIFRVVKILYRIKPNIVGIHSTKSGLIGRIACMLLRLPAIFTIHGWSFADGVIESKRENYAFIERLFSKITKHFIAVSYADKRLAEDYKITDENNITVIHNGVKESALINNNLKQLNVVKFINVARFSEQKDHITLIKAFSEINNENWSLSLVGDGPLENDTKQLVERLGLSDKIKFLGLREDVPDLLSKSHVFTLISNWEGLPISILEAMSLNLPIIASDVGGVNEIIEEGINGFLIPRSGVISLKKVLEGLLTNPKTIIDLGFASRERYLDSFTFQKQFEKTITVYQKYAN